MDKWIVIAIWVYVGLSGVSVGISLLWLRLFKKWAKNEIK